MSAEKKYTFNIIAIVVLVLAIFAAGYFARKDYVKNKEVRELEKVVASHKDTISFQGNIIRLKSDTINNLKAEIKKGNIKISGYANKIGTLKNQLANLANDLATIPANDKYELLVERTEPDTLDKPFKFSDRQIGYLYQDNRELELRRDEVVQYESITEALSYNLELTTETYRIANEQLTTCQAMNEQYAQSLLIKDKEIKAVKRQKKGRGLFAVISTTVAAIATTILVLK